MHLPGCQKSGAFHIRMQKNRVSHTLFVEKRRLIIYLAPLRKGAIWHAHPYYVIYRKLHTPPPSPPSECDTLIKCIGWTHRLIWAFTVHMQGPFFSKTAWIIFCLTKQVFYIINLRVHFSPFSFCNYFNFLKFCLKRFRII